MQDREERANEVSPVESYNIGVFYKKKWENVEVVGFDSNLLLEEVFYFWENNKEGLTYLKVEEYDWKKEREIHKRNWENENEQNGEKYPYEFGEEKDPLNWRNNGMTLDKFVEMEK